MNIILIIGIVLVAAAVGLLGFAVMQGKKSTSKDDDDDKSDKKGKKDAGKDNKKESDDEEAEAGEKPASNGMGIATKSFLIICTLTFWALFLSASYWAYTAEPLYGLMLACASILTYAILVVLQEILKNLINLNQQPAAPEEEESPIK